MGHNRAVARAALLPVRRVFRFDHEVGAIEADCGTAPGGIGRQPAAAASGLGLKDAPAILAGMDAEVGLLEHEGDVIAPHLLASAAPEGSIAGSDALAHLAGEAIGGKETVERRGRLDLSFVVDELLEIEVGADVALGGHRHRGVLQMIGQGEQLRTIASGNEAREGLAELMGRERPCPSLVMAHAVVSRELANPRVDVHVADGDHLAVLGVARQEEFVAARSGAQRFADAFQHLHRGDHGRRREPAFEASADLGGLEQARDEIGLFGSGRAKRRILDCAGPDRKDLARAHANESGDDDEAGVDEIL